MKKLLFLFTVTACFYSTSIGQVNLAKGKPTKSSSVNFGGESSRAVDGKTSGVWTDNTSTHSQDEKDPWWEVDLGAVYDISEIRIWNRTDECCWDRLRGFYVAVSETPITSSKHTTLFTPDEHFFTKGQNQMSIKAESRKARYVRIFIPGDVKILTLSEVEVFGAPAIPVTLPPKFKIHAYSVFEGKGDQNDYWFALNNGSTRGEILSAAKLVNGAKWMEIERKDLGNNIYAFKVTNAGTDMYLMVKDAGSMEVHVVAVSGGNIPDEAKFKSITPLTAAKGANENNYRSFESVKYPSQYLRHQGFKLFVHKNNGSELFKQDASWLIQQM